jgi:hypothetical protein
MMLTAIDITLLGGDMTMKKEYGGLGVLDLRELNLCLLGL